jgi:hypothetical protein
MICQPQSHRRRPVVIAMHALPSRQQPRPMSPMKVVIEELQAHECIEGWHRVWRTRASCG